ncbi:hypothetical protein VZT92_021171 [Zoarces viviparus]|uniref:Uncharacterized protein n=1 Tax=Zoarces viviparus TaxID=48416 RepID=A0AAW1EHT4_ZOAVI
MHATTVSEPDTLLDFTFDFDGVVMELSNLAGVKARVHYLNLPMFQQRHLHLQYNNLKKHVASLSESQLTIHI